MMRSSGSLIFYGLFCYLFFSPNSYGSLPNDGLAINPMSVMVKENRQVWVSVQNGTEREYVIVPRIVPEDNKPVEVDKNLVLLNPPVRLLKKRDSANIGLIYTPGHKPISKDRKYFLSVSFIPKDNVSDKDEGGFSVPVILSQQIPVIFP